MMNNVSGAPNSATTTSGRHGRKASAVIAAMLLSCTAMSTAAWAADAPAPAPEDKSADGKEIVVTGSLNALPLKDVGTIFGFNKTLVDTPRSASTVSKEQMERFGVTEIYDLVSQSPGTFTNSFFGVGGALDIRGTPGETYFRGMRRLDNAGNYPTPIGASDRIDIVRGPASPIYGPSKTGGYMNFVPKTARAAGGKYLESPEGEVTYTTGAWKKSVLTAQVRGPGSIGGQKFGYSLYGELEDSGSYYRNMFTKQTILQASFDADIAPNLRVEFGGMYQKYSGQQNGGWNRLTQALVDNGTYITGQPSPLGANGKTVIDANNDGKLSNAEFAASGGGLSNFGSFFCGGGSPFPSSITAACYPAGTQYALTGVGTTTLSRKDTLTGKNDLLKNTQKTAYMDLIFTPGGDLEIKNQLFYDGTNNLNENAYGFSQFVDSYVIEDKIVISDKFTNSMGKFSFQLSPSVRYTNFHFGDDFNYEYFNRVDLTQGYNQLSTRLLSTQCDCNYADYYRGHYTDFGFAGLTDLDFNFGLDVTLGARYDTIKVTSTADRTKYLPADVPGVLSGTGTKGGWSWTASANYKLPYGIVPYVTVSRQTTTVVGEGAEISPADAVGKNFLAASKLYEGGIKGTWLGGRLYAAISIYSQTRTDHNVQSAVTNQSVETKGIEGELRWAVDKHLLVTAAYTKTKVYNLTFIDAGTAFSFYGAGDLTKVNPANFYGGQPIGLLLIPNADKSRRAGIPENVVSATATYSFDNGFALAADFSHVQSVFSGQSQVVKLPAYSLVDVSATYKTGPWLFRVVCKNCTNATYFRANFTELFGATIALPEKPRSWQASLAYKF